MEKCTNPRHYKSTTKRNNIPNCQCFIFRPFEGFSQFSSKFFPRQVEMIEPHNHGSRDWWIRVQQIASWGLIWPHNVLVVQIDLCTSYYKLRLYTPFYFRKIYYWVCFFFFSFNFAKETSLMYRDNPKKLKWNISHISAPIGLFITSLGSSRM